MDYDELSPEASLKEYAYIDGVVAYQKGITYIKNPFVYNTPEAREWNKGWQDCRKLMMHVPKG